MPFYLIEIHHGDQHDYCGFIGAPSTVRAKMLEYADAGWTRVRATDTSPHAAIGPAREWVAGDG